MVPEALSFRIMETRLHTEISGYANSSPIQGIIPVKKGTNLDFFNNNFIFL
jgi:hypothetical protein